MEDYKVYEEELEPESMYPAILQMNRALHAEAASLLYAKTEIKMGLRPCLPFGGGDWS